MPPEMFVKRPVEWLRVDHALSCDRQLCAQLRLRPVRAAREGSRPRRARSLDWRVAGCGAEPINAPRCTRSPTSSPASDFAPSSFLPSYGLAEHVLAASVGVRQREPRVDVVSGEALSDSRVAAPAYPDDDAAIRLVSCGRPLPGHALRIVADDGAEARERQVGEIVLAGPSVMRGYCKDPESTSEVIRDGWLHTGDLGYLSEGRAVCLRASERTDRDRTAANITRTISNGASSSCRA